MVQLKDWVTSILWEGVESTCFSTVTTQKTCNAFWCKSTWNTANRNILPSSPFHFKVPYSCGCKIHGVKQIAVTLWGSELFLIFKNFLAWNMMQISIIKSIMWLCQRKPWYILRFRGTQVDLIVYYYYDAWLYNTIVLKGNTVRVFNFEGFKFSWISWLLSIHEIHENWTFSIYFFSPSNVNWYGISSPPWARSLENWQVPVTVHLTVPRFRKNNEQVA